MSIVPASKRKPRGTPLDALRVQAIAQVREMVLTALDGYDAEVWLIGSCARGDVHSASDIDVAVLPHGPMPPDFWEGPEGIEMVRYHVDLVDLRGVYPRGVPKDLKLDPAELAELLTTTYRGGIKWRDREPAAPAA